MKLTSSYHQERLWFIDRFEKGIIYTSSPVYHNVPLLIQFNGKLKINFFRASISEVVNRHEALRTVIITEDEQPVQFLKAEIAYDLQITDLVDNKNLHLHENVVELALEDCKIPFDLDNDCLLRVHLYRISENQYLANLIFHHLIVDKRSLDIIGEEILRRYQSKINEQPVSLADLKLQFADFSHWQRNLPERNIENLMFYWKRRFAKMPAPLELPEDYLRPAIHTFTAGRMNFKFNPQLTKSILTYCNNDFSKIQLFLLAAFKILLSKYAKQNEVNIGIVANNRLKHSLENVVGPIDTLLPIKSEFISGLTFSTYLKQLEDNLAEALKYKDMPFERLVQLLNPVNDMSRTALFDVLFHVENNSHKMPVIEGLEYELIETNLGWGKYDLNMYIDLNEGLDGVLVYNLDLFTPKKIEVIISCYKHLLGSVIQDPGKAIDRLTILDEKVREKLLKLQNRGFVQDLPDKTIPELLQGPVSKSPASTALVINGNKISYNELHDNVNRIAASLIAEYNVQPNDFIGLILDRSEFLIYAILGVLKSGAAYVPIDPNYPMDRIQYILDDCKCSVIISEKKSTIQIKWQPLTQLVDVRKLLNHTLSSETALYKGRNSKDDAAYVIYTSGTTGKPKGCVVSHYNLINLFRNGNSPFQFNHKDIWILAHSYCFDFSVWEIFGALLNGAQLVIPDLDTVKDTRKFLTCIQQNKVTVLNQTPPAFSNFMEEAALLQVKKLDDHLRYIIFGGDKLLPTKLKRWTDDYGLDKIRLINMYGITETTVHVTYYEIKTEDIADNLIVGSPIGKPLPGVMLYILDEYMQPLPMGCNGEVYVGGLGVSKGYWQREQLNTEKFIDNPFFNGDRLYRTGDVARWNQHGEVNYISRNDDQIKIRGHRIEKGEIEYAMRGLDYIRDALVLLKVENQESYLSAYVIMERQIERWKIANDLKALIPEYMIPKFIIPLQTFPLNTNGKIDLKKLPESKMAAADLTSSKFVSPKTPVEKQLLSNWIELLNIEQIGIQDNFFELGGHSLKATRALNYAWKSFGVKIDLKTFFVNPTIEALAKAITSEVNKSYEPIQPVEEQAHFRVSNAQLRIWLASKFAGTGNVYNVPYTYKIKGKLDCEILEDTFLRLVQRHEILRTNFVLIEEKLRQKIKTPVNLKFKLFYEDFSGYDSPFAKSLKKAKHLMTTSFDLENDLLINANLLKYDENKYLFLINLHHIISDGWSIEILLSELHRTYLNLTNKNSFSLPPPEIQYKDFTIWFNHKLAGDYLNNIEKFWISKLDGAVVNSELPSDYPTVIGEESRCKSINLVVNKVISDSLKQLVFGQGGSQFLYLLTAIKILVARYSRKEDIMVVSPVAGRKHQDLEHLVGYLSNTVIFRTLLPANLKISEAIDIVKNSVMETLKYDDFPFDKALNVIQRTNESIGPMPFQIGYTWHAPHEINNWPDHEPSDKAFVIEPFHIQAGRPITDLWFHGFENDNRLSISVDYNMQKFSDNTINTMLARLEKILEVIVSNEIVMIADIPLAQQTTVVPKDLSFDLNF